MKWKQYKSIKCRQDIISMPNQKTNKASCREKRQVNIDQTCDKALWRSCRRLFAPWGEYMHDPRHSCFLRFIPMFPCCIGHQFMFVLKVSEQSSTHLWYILSRPSICFLHISLSAFLLCVLVLKFCYCCYGVLALLEGSTEKVTCISWQRKLRRWICLVRPGRTFWKYAL